MRKWIVPVCGLAAWAIASCARPAEPTVSPQPTGLATNTVSLPARKLFLKNCAHCHGADGTGDEGPDLHHLDLSDEQIVNRIRQGKKGQMTAFAGKLQPAEIATLTAYLRTLN